MADTLLKSGFSESVRSREPTAGWSIESSALIVEFGGRSMLTNLSSKMSPGTKVILKELGSSLKSLRPQNNSSP
jgi:hypothetical protein